MEEQIWRKRRPRRWKWALGILALAVLLALAAGIVVFKVNRFSLAVVLDGEPEIKLEYGEHYEEPGAHVLLRGTLIWQEGITPEADIQIQSEVAEDTVGKYTVVYTADYRWWSASAQRTVWIVDTQCPQITLVPDPEGSLVPGTRYQEAGFTATDNYDGDITDRVVRIEKEDKITYAVIDSSGNPAYAQREIPFYDAIPPEIHLEGGADITINAGTYFRDPGFSAADNLDGDLTEQVAVEGEVVWYAPGTYTLTYTVADSFQNKTTAIRRIEVQGQPSKETVTPEGKVIYLTFDDGPGPYTEQLLEVLAKYDVKATFFVTNSGYYDAMKKIAEEGHSIGIHTMTHNYGEIYASPEAFFQDLYGMQDIIYKQTGKKTTLMRFPGGSSNTVSCFTPGIMSLLTTAVEDAGFRYFDWNVDSNDAGGAKTARKVFENVTEGVSGKKVSVVLQHDIHAYSVEAVEDIIVWGLENGYTFLPLQEDSPTAHHGVNN